MPDVFYDSCWEDVMCVIAGAIKRHNKSMQQTRLLMYTIACTVTAAEERGEVYDMFFIPGDPTEEERQQAMIDSFEAMRKVNDEFTELIRNEKMK
jgi:hypothetical protein